MADMLGDIMKQWLSAIFGKFGPMSLVLSIFASPKYNRELREND
ncbi:hypothetical protein OH491_26920 [Termitidicoccus mucosus]